MVIGDEGETLANQVGDLPSQGQYASKELLSSYRVVGFSLTQLLAVIHN